MSASGSCQRACPEHRHPWQHHWGWGSQRGIHRSWLHLAQEAAWRMRWLQRVGGKEREGAEEAAESRKREGQVGNGENQKDRKREGKKDGGLHGSKDRWKKRWQEGGKEGRKDGRKDGRNNRWEDGWMEGWKEKMMDGRMDRRKGGWDEGGELA